MLKLSASSFVKLGFVAGTTNAMLDPVTVKLLPSADEVKVPAGMREITISYLTSLRDELALPINAKTAIAELDRLIALLEKGECDARTLRNKHYSAFSRIEDELHGTNFLYIDRKHIDAFEGGPNFFGPDVARNFPGLAFDIDEAGKCLALERSTAAAFHGLRCLEAGIKALARCLGLPDPARGSERNWGAMLRNISVEMDTRWPKSGPGRMTGDGKLFEEAHAALAAIQNPWRNATMHLEHRYNQEEAEDLLVAVRMFMQRLARRMDEEGNPKA